MRCWEEGKANGTITHAMADSRAEAWIRILTPFKDKVQAILEIGCYEGQSGLFWLDFFPGVVLTCVDPWAFYTTGCNSADEVEEHFDANLEGKVNKIKSNSIPALYGLRGMRFDLIYIDGDHGCDQVMIDSLMAWRLLRPGGIMIWDDYITYSPKDLPRRRPEPAINAFIALKADELSILENTQEQMIVQKGG